jgi:hypothetical protein
VKGFKIAVRLTPDSVVFTDESAESVAAVDLLGGR